MSKVEKFEDLVLFQKARKLSKEIYGVTSDDPWKRDTRFVQQIRAAVGSIMDNIAEGYERDGNKEFKNFLYIAKGSCGEVRSQIIRASDVGFLDNTTSAKLYGDCLELSKGIAALIKSLNESEYKGSKFKEQTTK